MAPEEPPSSELSGTEDAPVIEGSKPLIGEGAGTNGIKFPKALALTEGAKILKSMGYGKEVPGVHPTQRPRQG